MRCAIYVRVSREEQLEGWSLDAQLEQCQALAALRKWQIAHVYEEMTTQKPMRNPGANTLERVPR